MLWNVFSRLRSSRSPLLPIIMLATLILYTLLGALAFCALESANELEKIAKWSASHRQRELHARERLLADLQYFFVREVNVTRLLSPEFQHSLDLYDKVMEFDNRGIEHGLLHKDAHGKRVKPKWNIWGGLYFAGTIFTTIGYGDIVAETIGGKCLVVIYALIGIPLIISFLNVWGNVLLRVVQSFWYDHLLHNLKKLPVLGERRGIVPMESEVKFLDEENQLENYENLENNEQTSNTEINENFDIQKQSALVVNNNMEEKNEIRELPLKFRIAFLMLGFGDYTTEHKVACAYFILILIGLAVVSMSLRILQIKMESLFYKICRSIDSDFKNNLIEEKQTHSISTSTDNKVQDIEELRVKNGKNIELGHVDDNEGNTDAIYKYRNSMSRSEKLMVIMLMGQHWRNMLDEKLRSRHKMRNNSTQTDDFLTDAQIQTEQVRSLRPISSLFTNRSVEGEETDDDEVSDSIGQLPSTPISKCSGSIYRRNNTMPNAVARQHARGRGLGRKRMYIYNTGD
uniref:Potassium channel domain-containing protein n=1 Tax=Meloidogyne javanica TaxID=6303 RepID=A0A915LQL8_MELJA